MIKQYKNRSKINLLTHLKKDIGKTWLHRKRDSAKILQSCGTTQKQKLHSVQQHIVFFFLFNSSDNCEDCTVLLKGECMCTECQWNNTNQGKPKYLEKKSGPVPFYPPWLCMKWLGIEPGPLQGHEATSHLCYGMPWMSDWGSQSTTFQCAFIWIYDISACPVSTQFVLIFTLSHNEPLMPQILTWIWQTTELSKKFQYA